MRLKTGALTVLYFLFLSMHFFTIPKDIFDLKWEKQNLENVAEGPIMAAGCPDTTVVIDLRGECEARMPDLTALYTIEESRGKPYRFPRLELFCPRAFIV